MYSNNLVTAYMILATTTEYHKWSVASQVHVCLSSFLLPIESLHWKSTDIDPTIMASLFRLPPKRFDTFCHSFAEHIELQQSQQCDTRDSQQSHASRWKKTLRNFGNIVCQAAGHSNVAVQWIQDAKCDITGRGCDSRIRQ